MPHLARLRARVWPALLVGTALSPGLAAEDVEAPLESDARTRAAEARIAEEREHVAFDSYFHWFGSTAVGRGIRFNNPYRLERVLGDTPESPSLSALYLDLAVGVAQGEATGLKHGVSLDLALALTGIRQEVLTPSYRLLFHPASAWLASARLGFPLVLEPDVTSGIELGATCVYRVFGRLGVYWELIGSLFFGAATLDVDTTLIPLVSGQLGVWFDYEVFE